MSRRAGRVLIATLAMVVVVVVRGAGPVDAAAKRRRSAPTGAVSAAPPSAAAAPRERHAAAPTNAHPRPHVGPPATRGDTGAGPPPARTTTTATLVQPSGEAGTAVVSPGGEGAAPPAKVPKTKVYTFGAMDVEGKLKTPQLLYFLNRVKLELDMSAPDHRSFMKELEKTAEDSNL